MLAKRVIPCLDVDRGRVVKGTNFVNLRDAGDPVAVALLQLAGRRIGSMLASVVNFFNPSLIVIGGGVANSPDQFLAAIRETEAICHVVRAHDGGPAEHGDGRRRDRGGQPIGGVRPTRDRAEE